MSFLDIFRARSTRDVVGIWGSDYGQVFQKSRPVRCSVTESSKNMEHPLETGAVITDHRIILPVEIALDLVMEGAAYYDQYTKIKQAFVKGDLFSIHTKTGIYKNMMIVQIPHQESPDQYDTITMSLTLKEVIFVTAQFQPLPASKVKTSTNQSTKDKGQVQTKDQPVKAPTTTSGLKQIGNGASNLLDRLLIGGKK